MWKITIWSNFFFNETEGIFSKHNIALFLDFLKINNGKNNMLKHISTSVFFSGFHYHLKQMKYKYPTPGELELQQKYFLVSLCTCTFITWAALTVINTMHLKYFSTLTLLRLEPTTKMWRACFCFNGIY